MTRDELETELETLIIGTPKMSDVMSAIDSYAAAQRADIEQQIASHVERRLVAERERIAQAIEADLATTTDPPQAYRLGIKHAVETVRSGGGPQ